MTKQVSLVLGGGGAKGFVHAGVIEGIVERGYEIVAVFGTSIGAIVGSLFTYYLTTAFRGKRDAQQLAAAAVKDVLLTTDFLRLADMNVTSLFRRGLLKGKRVRDRLEVLLMNPNGTESLRFKELGGVELNVTITDALTGESILANRENTPDLSIAAAVRASMSIQGVFLEETIKYQGKELVCWDGGLTGNCRFDLSHAKYPELLTIASSVTYGGKPRLLPNSFWTALFRPMLVADRASDFWLRQIENLTAKLLAPMIGERILIVRPDVASVTTVKFWIPRSRRLSLFANGNAAVQAELARYEDQHAACR